MKKLNCKHGLERKQELEARKMKKVLEGDVKDVDEIVKRKIEMAYERFRKENRNQFNNIYLFYEFLEEKERTIYSAFERVGGYISFVRYVFKNKIV